MIRRGCALATIATALVLSFPLAVSAQGKPTNVALILRISSPPLFDQNAQPKPSAKGRLAALQKSLGGLLTGPARGVPIAIAPSPVFCDELALYGSDEARSVLATVARLAKSAPVLLSPYADVRVPELTADEITAQVATARRALRACTDKNPGADMLPPDFALDHASLRALRARGIDVALSLDVRKTPVVSDGVELLPAHASKAAQPVDVAAGIEKLGSDAVVLDGGRSDLAKLVASLAQQPGLQIRPLDQVRDHPRPAAVDFPTATSTATSTAPPRSYRLALAGAENAVARLRSFTLSDNPLVEILQTSLARARSSAEWNDRFNVGRDRARAIVRIVGTQRHLLSVSPGSVTFTSRRGSIPVTVANRARYPARVRVTVSSPKLAFSAGSSRIVVVKPPGDTITLEALARSTGTFPMRVVLESVNGKIEFGTAEISVRSTAANVPALALTAGGLVFLVGFYARGVARRRRIGAKR